ncbi:MAG TPA: vWA domain-containing protein, partial [Lacipirellula sp.]
MSSQLYLLAQKAVYGTPESGGLVSYRFGRAEQFDDPRWLWAGVAVVAALIALFVAWQYRRESASIPPGRSVLLAGLRLIAFAGAMIFFLSPLKRTDQQIVTESRVAVLVDASQSMSVQDEKSTDNQNISRSEAVLHALEEAPFIEQLRKQHDVTVAVFDSELRRVAQWKRHKPDSKTPENQPDASSDQASPDAAEGNVYVNLADSLKPLGAETRLGDALAAVLGDQSGGPLAGVYTFSDGGQNLGVDPLSIADTAKGRKAPVITVGVGSTQPRRNVRIQELIAPSRAFPDDKAVVRAVVQAEGYAGRTFQVELYAREGAAAAVRIGQESATIEAEGEPIAVAFEIEPAAVGRVELEARIVPPEDDQYSEDNR